MTRRLLGTLMPDDAPPFSPISAGVPVFGDKSISPDAEPWLVREPDCWVTADSSRGRLAEEFSYKFREATIEEPYETSFTWGGRLRRAMFEAGDDGPVECRLTAEQLADTAWEVAPHFLAWTPSRVYFPVKYDGGEWVESAPRNPCDEHFYAVGGG